MPKSSEKSLQARPRGAHAITDSKTSPAVPVRKATAEQVLSEVDEIELWEQLLTGTDKRIAFNALKYLTDRRDGKAAQAVSFESKKPFQVQLTIEMLGK